MQNRMHFAPQMRCPSLSIDYSQTYSISIIYTSFIFWCRIHLWFHLCFRLMGGLQAKSMTSQRYRATYKMADMFYYGNVMTTTRWRLYVTMETLRQQQDGGYALLWKRYPNIQITSTFAVEDVYIEFVIDVFYIFNSTVIDWTCLCTVFFYPAHLSYILTALQKQLLT